MKRFTYKNKTNSWMVINTYPMTKEIFSTLETGTDLDKAKFHIDKEHFEISVECSQDEINLCESIINSNKLEFMIDDIFELLTAELIYENGNVKNGYFTYAINNNYKIKSLKNE